MNASSIVCAQSNDGAFGPFVHNCRDDFDFTLTFEQAFFSIAPSAALVLAGVARLRHLFLQQKRLIEANTFRWLKTITIALFAALQLALVVLWSTRQSIPAQNIGITAAALSFLASITLGLLSPLEHAKSLTPSTIICLYLLLTLLFDATILRTFWIFTFDEQVRRVFSASFTLKAIILFLEAKEKREYVSRENDEARSPEEFTGIYGKSLYWWLNGLIKTGYKKVLIHEELYQLPSDIEARTLAERFQESWESSQSTSKHKIYLVLFKALKWPILAPIVPRILLLVFTFCQPLLLQRLLNYLQDPVKRQNDRTGYALIGAYFLTYFGIAIFSGIYWLLTYRSLTMIRGMLVTAIYRKTTVIDLSAVNNAKAITLMGTDAERVVRGLMDFHELWSSALQVGFATWLLANELGAAAAGPVAVCLVSVAATVYGGTLAQGHQVAWIGAIQERIGMTTSMLGSMKSVRSSGLTAKVRDTVHKLRLNEIKNARRFWFLGSFTSTIGLVPQMISPVISFAIFTASSVAKNKSLDFSRMFTSLALLILLTQPLFNLFAGIVEFLSAIGCIQRINDYLSSDSRKDTRMLLSNTEPSNHSGPESHSLDHAVELHDTNIKWSQEQETPTLKSINLNIPASKLTFLIGPIASGKSTLLKGILGELTQSDGAIAVSTKEIAFCDQSPWLFNGTIRENITAFSSFDREYYRKTIRACALENDLAELQSGDATKVGSKGFALSSGQKQRIALARAVYSRKTIMLMDDIVSQLDAPTQNHIVAHLLGPDGLLRAAGTTVLLATHAVNFLPVADKIVALGSEGTVMEQGTFEVLCADESGYVSQLYREQKVGGLIKLPAVSFENEIAGVEANINEASSRNSPASDPKVATSTKAAARQTGDSRIYLYYFSCLGWLLTAVFFLFQVTTTFLTVFPTIWLKWWAESNSESSNSQNAKYAGGYAGFQVAALISTGTLTWFSFNIMAQKAGLELHTRMLNAVIHAPMSLFSNTDMGTIITRFSQDFDLIDAKLPLALMCVVTNLFITIGQAALIASASAWIALSFPFLIAVFYVVQRYYLRTSRQIRLLDLEQKAPLYTQFTESIEGLATLRAFAWQSSSMDRNHVLVNNSQRPFYLLYMIQKWLALVLDLIITGLAVVVVSTAVALRDTVSVGFTGVSLSQIISLTGYMKLIILFWAQMETSLGAVTRIKNFCQEVGDENLEEENESLPENWPEAGAVSIEGLSVTYQGKDSSESHVALKDVTLSIAAGTKLGVCGRTASGKTTLILSLLKLVESEGSITIDCVDHSTIPRQLLRERITVVSDEPYFLTDVSLRANLDPTGCCSDDELLKRVLRAVLLWDVLAKDVEEDASGQPDTAKDPLDRIFKPSELSHGQTQLFALARAMVRHASRNKSGGLVILDEATSRTDKATDAIIQRIIREWFTGCTLIVIAHRLESIMDFDEVVVLDKGSLVEFGRPEILRNNPGGIFRDMCGDARVEGSDRQILDTEHAA